MRAAMGAVVEVSSSAPRDREERRVARSHRRELRAAGLLPPEEYVAPEDLDAAVDGSAGESPEPDQPADPDTPPEPEES